jgi:hypothetical protein
VGAHKKCQIDLMFLVPTITFLVSCFKMLETCPDRQVVVASLRVETAQASFALTKTLMFKIPTDFRYAMSLLLLSKLALSPCYATLEVKRSYSHATKALSTPCS